MSVRDLKAKSRHLRYIRNFCVGGSEFWLVITKSRLKALFSPRRRPQPTKSGPGDRKWTRTPPSNLLPACPKRNRSQRRCWTPCACRLSVALLSASWVAVSPCAYASLASPSASAQRVSCWLLASARLPLAYRPVRPGLRCTLISTLAFRIPAPRTPCS